MINNMHIKGVRRQRGRAELAHTPNRIILACTIRTVMRERAGGFSFGHSFYPSVKKREGIPND
jgi:hypothetical protein